MIEELYSYVFKGLLTEEALDKSGRINKSLFPNENNDLENRLCLNTLDENKVLMSKNMSIVFCAIYSFENTVRAFISKKLLEEYGEDWWNKCVSSAIRKTAESRKKEEEKVKWHSQRGDALINYIDFNDLHSIINQNWKHFEPHFNSLDWVNSIFKPLSLSRNVIMHSGELSRIDIERIGTLIRDWISQTNIS